MTAGNSNSSMLATRYYFARLDVTWKHRHDPDCISPCLSHECLQVKLEELLLSRPLRLPRPKLDALSLRTRLLFEFKFPPPRDVVRSRPARFGHPGSGDVPLGPNGQSKAMRGYKLRRAAIELPMATATPARSGNPNLSSQPTRAESLTGHRSWDEREEQKSSKKKVEKKSMKPALES